MCYFFVCFFGGAGVFHVYKKIVQWIVQDSFQMQLTGLGLAEDNVHFYL